MWDAFMRSSLVHLHLNRRVRSPVTGSPLKGRGQISLRQAVNSISGVKTYGRSYAIISVQLNTGNLRLLFPLRQGRLWATLCVWFGLSSVKSGYSCLPQIMLHDHIR